ncbi:MAG: helix-turn-helix domain-containing protein [Vulcanimicrobiota bacterium]
MFRPLLHHTLRRRRDGLKLSQTELARRCGIKRSRYAMLELGLRAPSPDELQQLAGGLGTYVEYLGECRTRPPGYHQLLHLNANRDYRKPTPFFPPKDRATGVRLHQARRRYGDLMRAIEMRLTRRGDTDLCAFFCEELACDSAEEFLFILCLLLQGGTPGIASPNRYCHPPHPIVDPTNRDPVGHRALPAIFLAGQPHFIQASLATPRLYTVDVLRWNGSWSIIEVDGTGHYNPEERERTRALAVPIERLTTEDVLALAWRLVSGR